MSEIVSVRQLESGYWYVRGRGPCNWAQLLRWPTDLKSAKTASFYETGLTFITALAREGRKRDPA